MKSHVDAGDLFSNVLSLVLVVVLVGLTLALYRSFDGDVMAMLTWAGNFIAGLVQTIADWFSSNPFFQDLVRGH